ALARDRYWVLDGRRNALAIFLVLPIMATVAIERLALSGHWMEHWSYSVLMPVVPLLGVGLSPLLQWIVVPPAVLWLVRRQIR
nr:hypothetical protein [Pseudomonadota bacterium]